MTDIVARLRGMPSSLNDALRTMDEAAAEIVRLRRDKAQIAMFYDQALKEIERLSSQIDKMGMMHDGHR